MYKKITILTLSLIAFSNAHSGEEIITTDTTNVQRAVETSSGGKVNFGNPRIEFIGFRNSNGNQSYNNSIQARLFQPINYGNGWTSMSRIDGTIVSNSGPKVYTSGNNWQMGNVRWTFSTNTPELKEGFKLNGGWRVYFPVGSLNTMYSTAQWEIAPQAGFSYATKNWGPITSINPMVRYLMGFDPISQNTQSVRTLEIFPTIITKITEYTRLHFYDETAVTINANKGIWNLPIDAMLVHSFNESTTGKLGGSIKVNSGPAVPNWNIYGGVMFQF